MGISISREVKKDPEQYMWLSLRLVLGGIFLWAFFDKFPGLGYSTPPAGSWLNGGSPTYNFLAFGTKGFFGGFFHNLAGSSVVDWIFMLGLLGVGLSLVAGAPE